jgi:hypothetical protein
MNYSVQCPGRSMDELVELVFGDGEHDLSRSKSTGGWFAGAVKRATVKKVTHKRSPVPLLEHPLSPDQHRSLMKCGGGGGT